METKEILQKPIWKMSDFKGYLESQGIEVNKKKLYQIFHLARTKFDGATILNTRWCKRNSILAALGTDLKTEMENLNEAKAGNI